MHEGLSAETEKELLEEREALRYADLVLRIKERGLSEETAKMIVEQVLKNRGTDEIFERGSAMFSTLLSMYTQRRSPAATTPAGHIKDSTS